MQIFSQKNAKKVHFANSTLQNAPYLNFNNNFIIIIIFFYESAHTTNPTLENTTISDNIAIANPSKF
jgi:hypothetical protein